MTSALTSRLRNFATQEMWGVFTAPWDQRTLTIDQANAQAVVLADPDRCLADPIAVVGSQRWALAEELDFRRGPGRIVMIDLDGETDIDPIPVLEDDIHSSYPMTYCDPDDQLWLVPERAHTQRLEYYALDTERASARLAHVALEGRSVIDPTITFHQGHYYLFFVDGSYGTDSHLELYMSDSMMGPWERHPKSPIVTHRRFARPAGRIFAWNAGRLIRPAQDCETRSGSAISIQVVTKLTPEDYLEAPRSRLPPHIEGYTSGLHTLDLLGDGRCLFDAKTYHSSLSTPALRQRTLRQLLNIGNL